MRPAPGCSTAGAWQLSAGRQCATNAQRLPEGARNKERDVANKDLRDWIDGVKAAGELKLINGAEPKEEIGGIVDIYMRKMGNPAVMFDEVPGYPKGHRVLANILTSIPRTNLALGLPPDGTRAGADPVVAQLFQERADEADQGGERRAAARQRVCRARTSTSRRSRRRSGTSIDGGPFIGTACLVVMKDPDSRLGELRHLPRAVAQAEHRVGDDVARQARADHHAEVSRARASRVRSR